MPSHRVSFATHCKLLIQHPVQLLKYQDFRINPLALEHIIYANCEYFTKQKKVAL